ncbi:hypothetical protein C4564_03740 [Candidatus Microgenomates bacterium]|nr:MAG: hypothetical protein C4564_03740 [Candidatus Microgenomates bacterium]
MGVLIIKRDDTTEPYEEEKIVRVVQAAGLRPIDAEELAKKITSWIETENKASVSSIDIRDRVFLELEKVDKYASGLFAWYQTTKDKSYNPDKTSAAK